MELKVPSPNSRLTSLTDNSIKPSWRRFNYVCHREGLLKQRTVQVSFGSCYDIVQKGLYRCSTKLARHQPKINIDAELTLEFADIWLSKQVRRWAAHIVINQMQPHIKSSRPCTHPIPVLTPSSLCPQQSL